MTDRLSALTHAGPSNGVPIMRGLCLSPLTISTPLFIAENLLPKLKLSTLVCFFDCHTMGDMFANVSAPVLDLLVALLPA